MGILMETAEVKGPTSYRNRRRRRLEPDLCNAMGTPSEFCSEAVHDIGETEFTIGQIPRTLKYKEFQGHGYRYSSMQTPVAPAPLVADVKVPSGSVQSPVQDDGAQKVRPPPKKKWIKEYLEEEPKSPVSVRVVPVPCPASPAPLDTPTLDYLQEHSRPRTTSANHGPPQIPSPPSVGSNGSSSGSGSAPRAGTREVHNKLEKNRRAHLKECFELLKRQLPAAPDDKKTSNLSILGSAIRYIQVLRRKERECEHEMERLAREKIAAQQRLAALKRDVPPRPARARAQEASAVASLEDKERGAVVNGHGHMIGIPISITATSPTRVAAPHVEASPPRSLNLGTKLRALPIQITPTTSQMAHSAYGARHNTLTLTSLAPADGSAQSALADSSGAALGTALVHPAQIHLPLSQMVGGGGLVVAPAALQLLSAGGLRVLRANGVTAADSSRIANESGMVAPPVSTEAGMVVSGLGALQPLMVSAAPAQHLLTAHTLAHKMVETQVVKSTMTPLTVSAQYLGAAIVKPMVVVSGAHTPPAPAPAPHT